MYMGQILSRSELGWEVGYLRNRAGARPYTEPVHKQMTNICTAMHGAD